jgi:signal transduction histidine kinase
LGDVRRGRLRSRWAVVAVVALGLALTGCSGDASYSSGTASTLQHGVLAVAQAASTNDLAGAQAKLTDLERMNEDAARKGRISRPRHDAVAASIAMIRADLSQLQNKAANERLQQQLQQLQQNQQQQNQQTPQKPSPGDDKGKGKDGKGKGGG